ncbi:tripartite tricarboxylate transporter TctB family protein [Roseicyclus sp. F158]|uniref:Tripartite tricarboxylate transporter TctB family protein n=1 Tax=Tropicimonas omnivorans TaxID=3075590 RepID=A0ABU3DG43_9RHOB|nr:tripartite tricarboxylate transporter TctB family protein [Roseicyclus sp. F158]MDT0682665.1 tripartite tricarboxylate transporter TctB family protein [Roseicyclus sp. F158]
MNMTLADRLTAIAFAALGLAMAVGGYTMDRLEIRRIHPASIPGLVPMILGVLLVICAIVLWREARAANAGDAAIFTDGSWTRLGLTAAATLIYAIVLVGWLPFIWSTGIFVFSFATIFSWPEGAGRGAQAKAIGGALLLAVATGWGTSLLFRDVFLVRLP